MVIKMKRFFTVMVSIALVLTLGTSCDEKSPESQNPETLKTETVGTEKEVKVESEKESTAVAFEGVPDSELGNEMLKVFEKVESVHFSDVADMSVSVAGQNNTMQISSEEDISAVSGVSHVNIITREQGESESKEMYIVKNGDDATVYLNENNSSWEKQDIKVDQLAAVTGYSDTFDEVKVILGGMTNIKRSNVNHMGKPAILVEGVVAMDSPNGLVAAIGLANDLNEEVLKGLDAIGISAYLDSTTGLPVEINMDMTAFIKSLYDNMLKEMGAAGLVIDVDNVNYTMNLTEYNNVSVSVPDDVKA